MITRIRPYDTAKGNANFVETVFDWKNAHPTLCNSRELCGVTFGGEPENAEKYYETYMLSRNPFVGHDKSLSPFSKDFVGYRGMTEVEKEKKVRTATQRDKVGRSPNQVEYWTMRGKSRGDAKKIIHERQKTFTLEKCIERYGEEEGTRRWKERQERWQATLKSKPYEEQIRILKAKTENSRPQKPYSRTEREFSSQLVTEDHMNVYVTNYAIPDICVGNKIIDFFGDYYHCNPKKYDAELYNQRARKYAREIWKHDRERNRRLRKDGYGVKIVWESEYKKDKGKVIQECKRFLEGK